MPRDWLFLECTECGMRYYRTTKSTKTQAKLERLKYCSQCRRRVTHKERKK